MITKSDAIKIGAAIITAANREKNNNNEEVNARYVCNGLQHYALGNIWYDVLTPKTKEQFNYEYEAYVAACDRAAKGF